MAEGIGNCLVESSADDVQFVGFVDSEPVQHNAEPIPAGTMDDLKSFVALKKQKDDLTAQLKAVESQLDIVEPSVLDFLQQNGIQKIAVDGFLVYLKRDVRASFLGTEEAIEIARENGLGDMLKTTINANTAASVVREFIKAAPLGPLPAWIETTFSVYMGYSPAIRKA